MLEPFNETASFLSTQRTLDQHGVSVIRYQCGFFDGAKLPFEQQFVHVDGRTPRLVYFTVTEGDAQIASTLGIAGYLGLYADAWTAHSDPFDCGPLPTEIRLPDPR